MTRPALRGPALGRSFLRVVVGLVLLPLAARADRVARSELDYSSVQGGGSWFYGILQGTDGGPPVYSAAAFQQLDVFEPDAGRWRPSAALVGSQNTVFLAIHRNGAHPCGLGPSGQDRVIWPIRRYVTTRDSVSVAFQYENWNSTQPNGRGITARVFVDGGEVVSYPIRDAFDVKRAAPIIVPTAGTIVDLALDPLGVPPYGTDSPYSARSDGTGLYVGVYDYPCSTSADCVDVSCIGGLCCNPAVHLCPDAGTPDDAGVPDAGADPVDAGEPGDAGSEPPGPTRLTVGCGCASAVPGLGLLALALALRRPWRLASRR